MKKFPLIVFFAVFAGIMLSAHQGGWAAGGNVTTTVTKDTDIHYTGKYCTECHEKRPVKGGKKFLKYNGDFSKLCWCHGYTPGAYIHPVGVVPSKEKKKKIPKDFPLVNGRLSCITCHDIYLQCRVNPQAKSLNKRFLRGAPYLSRTTLCFRCHDEKKYKMLDPHNQLTRKGEIIIQKCLYCHVEKPDEKRATFKEVKLIGNLEVLCYRCHFKQSRLHPINANHLRKPTAKILAMMKESEKKYGIILPLDYEGKITCPTCHNPHERGVIPTNKPGAKGASEKYRLRLSKENLQICIACHKDKFQQQQQQR
ncbi:MAG: hypothetical protein GXP46_03625 [Deferribacteres bacterium]|nr:hypothetical protein [Deferribacteres bacterium]